MGFKGYPVKVVVYVHEQILQQCLTIIQFDDICNSSMGFTYIHAEQEEYRPEGVTERRDLDRVREMVGDVQGEIFVLDDGIILEMIRNNSNLLLAGAAARDLALSYWLSQNRGSALRAIGDYRDDHDYEDFPQQYRADTESMRLRGYADAKVQFVVAL